MPLDDRWPAELATLEADASGIADLEALIEHLDAAETLLWKAADATLSMLTLDYLWQAVDELTSTPSSCSQFAPRVNALAEMVERFAETDHWPPAIHLAINDIAALLADVRGAT
jgi:flagellar hook-associated protein FlgK